MLAFNTTEPPLQIMVDEAGVMFADGAELIVKFKVATLSQPLFAVVVKVYVPLWV